MKTPWNNRTDITGVILAGGKSSRMGTDKALVKLNGTPLIERIAQTLRDVFERVIIIANNPEPYKYLGFEIFGDVYKDCGPLGGIHSAFFHTTSEQLFIVGCDTPHISPELIRHIIAYPSSASIKVCKAGKQVQPLVGSYHRKSLPFILVQLENRQWKMMKLLEAVSAEILPIGESLELYSPDLFLNVNSREDSG